MVKKLLTRDRAVELLDRLNRELSKTNSPAELYVVGGAAMMLEYDGNRRTQDIDYTVEGNAFDVQAAAETITKEEQDIAADWLNDHAEKMGFIPDTPDTEARQSYQGSHLTVNTASPKRMLAMKMHAGRKEDAGDLMKLMTMTGVRTMDQAMEIFKDTFTNTKLTDDAHALMTALTSDPTQTPGEDTTGAGERGGHRATEHTRQDPARGYKR